MTRTSTAALDRLVRCCGGSDRLSSISKSLLSFVRWMDVSDGVEKQKYFPEETGGMLEER